jgi:hypothetical protein
MNLATDIVVQPVSPQLFSKGEIILDRINKINVIGRADRDAKELEAVSLTVGLSWIPNPVNLVNPVQTASALRFFHVLHCQPSNAD